MTSPATTRRPGLADVARLELWPRNQALLDHAAADLLGGAAWRRRKRAEAHGLLALSQLAARLRVRHLDLRTEIHAVIELQDTPIPCLRPGAGEIEIERQALLAIEMPAELLVRPIPGTRPVRVLAPLHVHHPNVGPAGATIPALCLGASVMRGLPLREMALACYAALTLQAINFDALDPAGLLNPEAAAYFQSHPKWIPLTTEPFLARRVARAPHAGDAPAAPLAAMQTSGREGRS